jgi:uncharacterized membrane protein YccC
MAGAAVATVMHCLTRYRREMVHAARMTAASITAYALVYLLGLSDGLWAVITAIVVTQSSIGGSLRSPSSSSWDRYSAPFTRPPSFC